jgi:hypothetical protein
MRAAVLATFRLERSRRDIHGSKLEGRKARHTRVTRNGDPDFGWNLRADVAYGH